VAAIVHQVLSDYGQPDPEKQELELVFGEGGVVLERSAESLLAGRMTEINKFHEKGVVKRWSREDAKKTGAKVFAARWVDDKFKVKSRYVIKEFANSKDNTVFAAASDFSTSRLVDYKSAKCGYPTFIFDVASAFTHSDEDELVFLEPPPEEVEQYGDCLWQSVKVIYGRRKGARSWQDHFRSVIISEDARKAGFTVRLHDKCPTLFYIEEADGVLELHVDDGHGTGDPVVIKKFLEYVADKIDLKWSDNLRAGASYEYLKCLKFHSDEGLWSCPNAKYIDSALAKMDMVGCNGSNSPKVSKSEEPGDLEIVDFEQAGAFRSAVLTLLYLSNERSDVQSSVRMLCTRLREPTIGDVRKLKKLLRYLSTTRRVGLVFNNEGVADKVLKIMRTRIGRRTRLRGRVRAGQ
jgi:hypothetical protein